MADEKRFTHEGPRAMRIGAATGAEGQGSEFCQTSSGNENPCSAGAPHLAGAAVLRAAPQSAAAVHQVLERQSLYVMGIDLGTGGVRIVVCDVHGQVAALATQPLQDAQVRNLPVTWHEQRAETWWPAAKLAVRAALWQLADKDIRPEAVIALAVTSTSGTVLPLDKQNRPLRPALMYNDGRAVREAQDLNEMAPEFITTMGYRFQASFALPKILWANRHESEILAHARCWVHGGDLIVGELTGDYGVSDHSTALKTGLDVIDLSWPEFIETKAGIPIRMLPRVVRPGATIAPVSAACAAETGLSPQTIVCGGMTDANTALLATGVTHPGDWNTTIGTTLGIKGITKERITDPLGRVYCHLHPMGWWLPGAASNIGGECLQVRFAGGNWGELDTKASARGPSSLVVYPLVRRGERYPFVQPEAEGFVLGTPEDEIDLYRGYLEGVALTERLAYAVLGDLGAIVGDHIYVAGGAAKSHVWLQIRSDVLGKTMLKSALPESAMGAAILAASNTLFSDVAEAGRSMVQIQTVVEADRAMAGLYQQKFDRFVQECRSHGYLN
jgi:sugar (pentulose or hexulose) kinase